MRFRPSLLLLLCALFTTFSCSKKTPEEQAAEQSREEAEARQRGDGEEIETGTNLVFTFDEPVVDATRQGVWDTTRFVQFSPAVPGEFKWTSDRELTFSPAQGFRPSTAYTARLRPGTLPEGKRGLRLNRRRFHTPYLQLAEPQLYYTTSRRVVGTTELRIDLRFNYPVRPADLRQRLRLTQNGQPVAVELPSGTPESILTLTVLQDVPARRPLTISIAPGLRPVGGSQPTAAPLTAQAAVPDPTQLAVRELTGALLNGQPVVTLLTTQPVAAAELSQNLVVTPRVAFAVEALESGAELRGGFEVGKSYQVTLRGGTRDLLGGTMEQEFSQAVSFGDEDPSLNFISGEKALYLSALGGRNLGLRINGVEKLKITIAKVYANNIQQLLRNGAGSGLVLDSKDDEGGGDYDEGEYYYRGYGGFDIGQVGNVISERTISTAGLPRENGLHLLHLNFKELEFQGPLKGLYVVQVQDTERRYLRESKLVAVTDVGLIVKQGATGGTLVFANSIRTAQPLSGVRVSLVSSNNQVLGTATTDAAGVAAFDSAASMRRFRLGLVTARHGADFSFLDLGRSQVETSRFEVGGLQSNPAHYLAFTYGDRNLYRPGDTVRTNTVVRTETWQTPPAGLPMKIRLLLPTGKEYLALRPRLDRAGAFESRFILPPAIQTGLYTLEVLTGNDVLLTSRQISVEEFLPDRLKVTVQAAPTVLRPGQTVTAKVLALNLFGPPASDRKFEVEFSLKEKEFAPKAYPDYSFSLGTDSETADSRFGKTVREGRTDAAGQGSAAYELPDTRDLGTLAGTAFATVFDETGRPVNRLATFEVRTQATMFGIQQLPDLVTTQREMTVRLLALTPAGQPTTAPAQVRVVRKLWETVLERRGGRFVYNSQQRSQTLLNQTLRVGKGTAFSFTPVYSGEYEVQVSRPGAATYVRQRFYAYGYGDTQANSFEVNKEGEVAIEADQPRYAPGQTATLLLKTPFAGRVLVTVERGRVLDHFYVNTDGKSARVKVPIKGAYVPNIYVTATAVRAIRDNRLPLTVARGFVPLTVARPDARLPCAIAAPTASRSQRFQDVVVSTAPRAQVTLAVVDEGILQIKNYQSPDPYAYFYQKRALEVGTFDVYPFLLPELGSSSSGGDASDLARRTTPVPNRRVQLVAKWSGVLTADASGKVRYRVRVPQFSGALRIMAVAYKGDAFGSAEHEMKVADPVVISTALPRFMSPGDTVDVPVTLTNTTGKAATGTASVAVTGPLRLLDAAPQTVTLPPNAEQRVRFRVLAPAATGEARLTATVAALGEQFTEKIYLPIRPAAPLEKRTGSGVVSGGKSQSLNLKSDFLPATLRSQLVVSRSPLTEFSDDLRYLLQYPYGCLEQTVSAAFPQLYYGDLAATLQQKTGAATKSQRYNPNYHVQEAIRKVEAMQLYDGSLSYWPGGEYDNWWATTYAAHFLIEARRAGFAVNKTVLDKVLRYLEQRLKSRETMKYQYFDASNIARQKTIANKEIAYSLYVLALAGRQDAVAMNYYRANQELLAEDSKFLLACTHALLGNERTFRALLPGKFGPERPTHRALAGSFYSPVRDAALVLNALLAADANPPLVPGLARQLSRQVKQAGWLNTQESAFALLALGKIARQNAKATVTATVLSGGKTTGQFTGPDLTIRDVAGRDLTLRTAGTGQLYYFWQLEGVPASGRVREEDAFLKVRREFMTRDGKPLARPVFRQNDLVVVHLTLEAAASAGVVENVAVTDLLPAGLEIENPRIGAVRELSWATNASQPQYLDVRDDRLNLFTTATPTPQHFYYLCRAVSKGTFTLGPVSADAMYNAEYHSYHGAGTVRVE